MAQLYESVVFLSLAACPFPPSKLLTAPRFVILIINLQNSASRKFKCSNLNIPQCLSHYIPLSADIHVQMCKFYRF